MTSATSLIQIQYIPTQNFTNQFHANTRTGNSSTRIKSDSIFSLNSTWHDLCYIGYNDERVHQGQESLWAPVYNGMTRPPAQPWAGSTLTPQFHSRDTFDGHYKTNLVFVYGVKLQWKIMRKRAPVGDNKDVQGLGYTTSYDNCCVGLLVLTIQLSNCGSGLSEKQLLCL